MLHAVVTHSISTGVPDLLVSFPAECSAAEGAQSQCGGCPIVGSVS